MSFIFLNGRVLPSEQGYQAPECHQNLGAQITVKYELHHDHTLGSLNIEPRLSHLLPVRLLPPKCTMNFP